MANKANNIFSVWAQNSSGDLFTEGASPGRGLSREAAWEMVKAAKAGFWGPLTMIKVLKGCDTVYKMPLGR